MQVLMIQSGCVPKKVMFNAATVSEIIHDAKQFGFTIDKVSFQWSELQQARDAYIARLNGIYAKMLANNKVEVITGTASFSGSNEVLVNDDTYSADHIVIAVGGKPFLPNIPGIEHAISSDGFFQLKHQPKSVAVVGAGERHVIFIHYQLIVLT